VIELPPNTQGVVALLLLNMLERFDLAGLDPIGPERFHLALEAARLALAVRDAEVADPETPGVPVAKLLDKSFAASLAVRIDPVRRMASPGASAPGTDTAYLTVVDRDRMAVSLINSLFKPFGVGIATERTGVMLQNRGACFVVRPGHPNAIGPRKRPMHTIIPALAFRNGRCELSFGVMGGSFQTLGHAHVLTNMVDYGMGVQAAIDFPRAFSEGERTEVERALPAPTRAGLEARGHSLAEPVRPHGGAQAIRIDWDRGVLIGARIRARTAWRSAIEPRLHSRAARGRCPRDRGRVGGDRLLGCGAAEGPRLRDLLARRDEVRQKRCEGPAYHPAVCVGEAHWICLRRPCDGGRILSGRIGLEPELGSGGYGRCRGGSPDTADAVHGTPSVSHRDTFDVPRQQWQGACRSGRGAAQKSSTLLTLGVGKAVETLLHLAELALEVVDLATLRDRGLVAFARLRFAPREGREHRKGALEHFHVAAHLILERREGADPEGLRHLIAKLFLLAGEGLDRGLEIAGNQHLHAVPVEPDQLAQEGDRQQVLTFLVLLFEDDLGQHRAGDILARLGVVDDEVFPLLDQRGEILERHICARSGIVEPPVGVFLDDDRFASLGHVARINRALNTTAR
jgi:hypothetical protein